MTYKELQRSVFDRLGLAEPPWPVALQVRRLLNTEYQRLVAEEDLSATKADLALVAADPLVTLPSDFLKILALRRGTGRMFLITADEFAQREGTNTASGLTTSTDGPWYYMFEAPLRIRVQPTPTTSDAAGIVAWYVNRPVPMSLDTDVPAALYGEWQDILIERVVLRQATSMGKTDLAAEARVTLGELMGSLVRVNNEREGGTYQIPIAAYGRR